MSVLAELFTPQRGIRAGTYTTGGRLADAPGWLERLIGGSTTVAGVEIDEENALSIDTFFCAVQLLSNAAMLPLNLYRRRTDDGRDLAITHPAYGVVHSRWNEDLPARRGRKTLEQWKLTWGNGYAEIERNRRGDVIAQHPIHPSRVLRRSRLRDDYLVRNDDGSYTPLPRRDMFHLMGFSTDGINGVSLVQIAREVFGLARATEIHGSAFFGNGARPGVVLKHPQQLEDEAYERLRKTWTDAYGGPYRNNKPAILEDGLEVTPLSIPNEDAQFLETRVFSVQQFARLTNIPPHKLKELSHATFSNIEHQQIEYVTDAIVPICTAWEDETDLKCLRAEEVGTVFSKFNLNALMMGDAASRAAHYKTMWEIGAYTINDILRKEDMNPIGPAGDVHFVQLNMTTAEKILRELSRKDSENPEAAEQVKFLREVVKGYLADRTTNDVLFNMTNARELMKRVDVPLSDYVEPYLPVRDDAGKLVSGEVIRDEEGDIVGGDVIEETSQSQNVETPKEEAAPAGDPPADPPDQEEGDGQDESDSKDLAESMAVVTAAAARAVMPVFVDAAARLVRKEVNAVTRAARKYQGDPAAFGAWADAFYVELTAEASAAFEAPAQVLGHLINRETPADLAARLAQVFEGSRGTMAVRFAAGTLAEWCADWANVAPPAMAAAITDLIIGK